MPLFEEHLIETTDELQSAIDTDQELRLGGNVVLAHHLNLFMEWAMNLEDRVGDLESLQRDSEESTE